MNNFPSNIDSKNKQKFKIYFFEKMMSMIRNDIYMHILKGDENDFFDLDIWCKKYINNNWEMMDNIIENIVKELNGLNWKCKLSYGGTGLFIYSGDIPSSCFDSDL